MRPASSFSFVLLTGFVTLTAWFCLAVMMLVFFLWAPFAWVALKLGSLRPGRPTLSTSISHTRSLLKQSSI
jgi:hypothetical protein